MLLNKYLYAFAILSIITFSNCKKADPIIPNEEELITTLNYTLTPTNGGSPILLSFRDLDGDGGEPPVKTVGQLAANTTYSGSLELLNETQIPTLNITPEILEEADAHQFFFNPEGNLQLTVNYTDTDVNNKPVGLSNLLTTGNASEGNFTITLRHEPDKQALGVAAGIIDNAGGETDLEVSFELTIQ